MKVLLFALLLIVLSYTAYAADSEYNGNLTITVRNLPRFEEYAVETKTIYKKANLDLTSYPDAKIFKTRLQQALKGMPNFAGKYIVTLIGCGTSCEVLYLINSENGKVWGNISVSLGALYRLNSKLLITNMASACGNGQNEIIIEENCHRLNDPIGFYELHDNKLVKIYELDPTGILTSMQMYFVK